MGTIWPVVRLAEIDSTNDLAKRWAVDPEAPQAPVVIRADRQTKGRGRGLNHWWSDPGSLTFSILLDPRSIGLAEGQTPLTSLATAVGLAEVLIPLIRRGKLGIRWPNDVEIDRKKIAGILPESVNTVVGPRLVIGIGLNVRNQFDQAPPEIRAMATSLAEVADRPLDDGESEEIFGATLLQVKTALRQLADHDPALPARWSELDQLRGQQIQIEQGDQQISGVVAGIDARGGLKVVNDSGEQTVFGGRVLRPPFTP